jgi:glycosyltransferase involved in cell wall biosynthesis
MTPLKFCMVTTFYPPANFGGDGIQVQRLARALVGRGHEVTVVHSQEAFNALSGKADRPPADEPDDGVRRVPVDAGVGAIAPLVTHVTGRPGASSNALRRALEGEYDVMHFHNPSLIGGPAALELGRARLRLYTAHEQWLLCPTHVLWKNGKEVCEKPQCFRCSLSYRRPPQLWRRGGLLERSLSGLDALITPSRTSASLHERFKPLVRIEHIPHFVPAPDAGAARSWPRPYFLFVGRLESIKGAGVLVEAFRRRRSEDLLVVGEGPLRDQLERAAGDLPHVHFLGWRSAQELDALYRGALAVVVPTLGHESFGLVAVEAFARGVPAVVHDFGALGELATDSGAALSYRDEHELDAALARIAGDPELRATLGHRAATAYRERWTEDAHMDRYLDLIAELERDGRGRDLDAAAVGTTEAVTA